MSINGVQKQNNEELIQNLRDEGVKGARASGATSEKGGIVGITYEDADGVNNFGKAEGKQIDLYAKKLMARGMATLEAGFSRIDGNSSAAVPQDQAVNVAQSMLGSYKSVSDFDVRELMKLLIQAFSQLMSTQRQADLNSLQGIMNTLNEKIDAMKSAKSAQYKSTLASAIGSIVAGSVSVVMAGLSATLSGVGLYQSNHAKPEFLSNANGVTDQLSNSYKNAGQGWSIAGRAFGDSTQGCNQITNGIANIISAGYAADKAQAEIEQTTADAMLEVWRKAQDQGQKSTESLMQFITSLLNMMQQLQQSVSSTEKTIVQS